METPETNSSQSNPIYLYILIGLLVLMAIGMFFLRRMAPLTPKTTNQPPLSPTEVPATPTVIPVTPVDVSIVPTEMPETSAQVTLKVPQPNEVVQSPLTVIGTVPPGWMFEGVVGIQLLNASKLPIAQTQGKEIIPGSWQSGRPMEFSGVLTFTTNAQTGYLVIVKDNPSGLPENDDSFTIPVKFQ